MKHILHNIGILLLIIFASSNVFGQVCYKILEDPSGYNNNTFDDNVETAACELRDIFLDLVADTFKVFDAGFYIETQAFGEGNYSSRFEELKGVAASESPYYLLLGRRSDLNGINTGLMVDFVLPTDSTCLSEVDAKLFMGEIKNKISSFGDLSTPNLISDLETAIISMVRTYVEEQLECCNDPSAQCTLCKPGKLETFLESYGFYGIQIELPPPALKRDPRNKKNDVDFRSAQVTDYANMEIILHGTQVNMADVLEHEMERCDGCESVVASWENVCNDTESNALIVINKLTNSYPDGAILTFIHHDDISGQTQLFKKFHFVKKDEGVEQETINTITQSKVCEPPQSECNSNNNFTIKYENEHYQSYEKQYFEDCSNLVSSDIMEFDHYNFISQDDDDKFNDWSVSDVRFENGVYIPSMVVYKMVHEKPVSEKKLRSYYYLTTQSLLTFSLGGWATLKPIVDRFIEGTGEDFHHYCNDIWPIYLNDLYPTVAFIDQIENIITTHLNSEPNLNGIDFSALTSIKPSYDKIFQPTAYAGIGGTQGFEIKLRSFSRTSNIHHINIELILQDRYGVGIWDLAEPNPWSAKDIFNLDYDLSAQWILQHLYNYSNGSNSPSYVPFHNYFHIARNFDIIKQ